MQWTERPRGDVAALARYRSPEFTGLLHAYRLGRLIRIAGILRPRAHALIGNYARDAHVSWDPQLTRDLELLVPDERAAQEAAGAVTRRIPAARVLPLGAGDAAFSMVPPRARKLYNKLGKSRVYWE
ncbi:MAG TPA: hypothetical protein VHF22_15705 [Planctomycetota bacterium]|nr:hypothetical protein [Planctomycetota bacterium]